MLVEIGKAPWANIELKKEIPEFQKLYKTKPIKHNAGGMLSPHMFATWCIINQLKPKNIIESGVWKGQGTWLLESICPNAKIYSLDPNLHYREYISKNVSYLDQDFSKIDWKKYNLDPQNTLLFFDDHQNAFERFKEGVRFGFKHFIFEDNYPTDRGDCYSLKKVFSHSGHKDNDGKTQIEPNSDDENWLRKNICVYQEFPPLFKRSKTRWKDKWNNSNYPTPEPILSNLDSLKYLKFFKESKFYTWLCYVKANDNIKD